MKVAFSSLFASALISTTLSAPPGCPYAKRAASADKDLTKRILPEVGFDPARQYVSTTGDHAFQPPGPNDIRGPCPGLNALANHGYFDRSGVTTLTQAVEAVNVVYGISPELGTALSAYAVIFDGNVLDQTWSIGGPNPSSGIGSILNLLGGEPSGINGHSVYEADSSVARGDYFLHNGDDYSLQLPFFQDLVDLAKNDSTEGKDVYTFDVLADHRIQRFNHSVNNNPNFFFSAFGGFLVTTAAHDFIQNFMSNHSEQFPGGYLDEKNLFSFFSIYRHPENGSIYHIPGHERIPDNWYKRPIGSEYTLADVVTGVLKYGRKYPEVLAIGGNTGKVNSFTGINFANITGGVYNTQNLLQGNNLQCFIYSAVVQQAVPSQLQFIYKIIAPVVDSLLSTFTGAFASLGVGCPQLENIDWTTLYKQYPGSKLGGKFGN